STTGNGTYRFTTPILSANTSGGTVLLHNSEGVCDAFVESGAAGIAEVGGEGGGRPPVTAKAGQFFSRQAGQTMTIAARPPSAFSGALPPPLPRLFPSPLARLRRKEHPPHPHPPAFFRGGAGLPRTPARGPRRFCRPFSPPLEAPEIPKKDGAPPARPP